jgi:hypothetical protein
LVLVVVALCVSVAGFGAVFATNAFAKSRICGLYTDIGNTESSSTTSAGTDTASGTNSGSGPDAAAIRNDLDRVRAFSKLLLLDRDLRTATEGLANDIDDALALVEQHNGDSTAVLPQLLPIVQSMDGHVRAGQRSCDLPVTGILH